MEEADTELSRLAQSQSYFGLLLRLIVVAVVSIVVVRWWRRGGGVHVRIGHLNRACVTRRSVHILLRNLTSKYEQQQDDTTIDCSNSNSLYRGTIREITPLFTDLSQPKCETKICKTQECKHQQKRANSWTVAPKRLKWIRWVLLLNMYHYQRNKMPTACAVLYSRCIETSKSCCFWGRGGEESSTSELLWRMRVSGASSASLLLWRKARRSRTTRCNHSLLRIQRCSWNRNTDHSDPVRNDSKPLMLSTCRRKRHVCIAEHVGPKHTWPKHARPKHARPEHARSKHARSKHARSKHARSEHARPEHAQPKHARPKHARPSHARPEHARPNYARPNHARPEHAPKTRVPKTERLRPPGWQTLVAWWSGPEGPGANLVPTAIREPDKWPWCRLQNVQDSRTLFRLVSWEGSTWASWDFPNMAVNRASSILCAFRQCTHLEAVCLVKDVRGVLASSCVL